MKYHQNRKSITGCLLSVFCLIVFLATPAYAENVDTQKTPNSNDKQLSSSECYPPCRAGFFCANKKCVSPCNPMCPVDQVCTRNGNCIPRVPQSSLESAESKSPAEPNIAVIGGNTVTGISQEDALYNQKKYDEFAKMKKLGNGLMVPGILGLAAAFGLGFASGYTGESTYFYAAIAVEAVGLVLFIPGIVDTVRGKKGMAKASRGEYKSPASTDAQHAQVHFAGIAPLLAPSEHFKPSGASIHFYF